MHTQAINTKLEAKIHKQRPIRGENAQTEHERKIFPENH